MTRDGSGGAGEPIPDPAPTPEEYAGVLRGFAGLRCLVVGDAMLDVFEGGWAAKLAPDAPVPVVRGVERTSSPGGAANVAANLRALGAGVSLISAVGDDETGDELLDALSAAGVATEGVLRVPGRKTVAKRRIQADGATLARLDSGDTAPLAEGFAQEVARMAGALEAEVVVVSDYSGGAVGEEVAAALRPHGLVVLDSKEPLRLRWEGLAAATPNHLEAQAALGLAPQQDPTRVDPVALGRALRERMDARLLALTLAEEGVLLLADGSEPTVRVPGRHVRAAHSNGAGDTFLSAFALALGCGAEPRVAAHLAVEAATLAVARPGTAPVGFAELRESLLGPDATALEEDLEKVRRSGGRIVLVMAGFDPARPEDLRALRRAKGLGDLLVVGVGVGDHSAPLLRELRCVDRVVSLEEAEEVFLRVPPEVCVVAGRGESEAIARKVEASGGEVVPASALVGGAGHDGNGHAGPVVLPGARG